MTVSIFSRRTFMVLPVFSLFFCLFFCLFLVTGTGLFAQDSWKSYVSVYDIFDDSTFGRSEDRDILLSVSYDAFLESDTVPVTSPDGEPRNGFLTAVTFDASKAAVLSNRSLPLRSRVVDGVVIYRFKHSGIEFEFSLERPPEAMLKMIAEHYANDEKWREPVLKHYRDNYVIRIHSAENVLEPWKDTISFGEAMLMATLIGDKEQWLWGIHDGNDILFSAGLGSGDNIVEPGTEDGEMYDFKRSFKAPAEPDARTKEKE